MSHIPRYYHFPPYNGINNKNHLLDNMAACLLLISEDLTIELLNVTNDDFQ